MVLTVSIDRNFYTRLHLCEEEVRGSSVLDDNTILYCSG